MFSFKTEGIILKRRNFGEADRILTVFTHKQGKISVLAKGVRRITSRRAGNVELLNRTMMYLHQGKGMPILTEAQSLNTYPKLKDDLILSTYAYHIIELVEKLTAEGQENPFVYEYLVKVLEKLSQNPRQILIRAFEVKILSALGFATFSPQNSISTPGVSIQTGKILEDLQNSSWDRIKKISITQSQALELERYLRYYIERTLEGELKSRQFLKQS